MVAPKRRWKRVKVDIRVKVRRWEEPEEATSVVRTYELSEGGMSIYASESLEVGTFMSIEFSLPTTANPLHVRAVVRNRRGFRCGMEFVDISPAASQEVLRYLVATEGEIEV
jgi:c-di-GMP-binding flagellar brake protein YcgR